MSNKALTPAAVKKHLLANHGQITAAVQAALKGTPLEGMTVRSMVFEPPAGFQGPCDPPCQDGFHCVPDSDGGAITWKCVPD